MKRLVAALLACVAMSAHATYFTGEKLLELLSSKDMPQWTLGIGYVIGVASTIDDVVVCIPDGTQAQQLEALTLSVLRAHPDQHAKSAHLFVAMALARAFPCKKASAYPYNKKDNV